jgi:hypothetical protein
MRKNYAGQIINGVEPLEFIEISNHSSKWKCKCVCGNIFNAWINGLQKGIKCGCKSGCKKRLTGKKSPSWKGIGDLPASFIANIKSQAKFRNIEWNLDIEYLWKLFLEQNKKCKYSGLELNFTEKYSEAIHNKGTASLDRIDSDKGYIIGNVQWIHKDINFMKQEYSHKRFINYCDLISNYSGSNRKDDV